MTHDEIEERRRDEARARVIRAAETVLARAYRGASRQEMVDSQWRVRASVVREMRRRVRG